ncbi:MAG: adenylosuccinate synthetase [Candidatus Competibacteraceae bacterium]|nr:adenylosuccinate synthetase [Candidatus Competibacteraceae bacterium]
MHLSKTAHVVIGAQFGDEGKGRLTAHHVMEIGGDAIVVRFNGGAQAGAATKRTGGESAMSWLTTRSVPRSSFRLTLPHRWRVRRAKPGAGNTRSATVPPPPGPCQRQQHQ